MAQEGAKSVSEAPKRWVTGVIGFAIGIPFTIIVALIVLFIAFGGRSSNYSGYNSAVGGIAPMEDMDYSYESASLASPVKQIGTTTNTSNIVGNNQTRTVTKNYMSIHVKSVKTYITEVKAEVEKVGGKVMNEYISISSADGNQSGNMTLLVPNKNADAILAMLESKSIRVVDKSINSYEITQQYTDLTRQLDRYEETYTKLKSIYNKAETVKDIIDVQTRLDAVQAQIDSVKGRKAALDQLSQNTQFTVYLGTNQYDLPYVPQGTFEFKKTFTLAVRSLVKAFDGLTRGIIWVFVYIPYLAVWALVIWGVVVIAKRFFRRK